MHDVLLGHVTNLAPQLVKPCMDIYPRDRNASFRRWLIAHNCGKQRRFSGAARPHDSDEFSWLNRQRNIGNESTTGNVNGQTAYLY